MFLEVAYRRMSEGSEITLWDDRPATQPTNHTYWALNHDGTISPSANTPHRIGGDPKLLIIGIDDKGAIRLKTRRGALGRPAIFTFADDNERYLRTGVLGP